MQLRMAWRNIWRQKRRTLITVVTLTLGVAGIVYMHSFGGGMWTAVIRIMTQTTLGNLQIHGNGYQAEPLVHKVVPDPVAVEAALSKALPGARPLQRVLGFGLIAAGEISTPAMIVGLQPERERATTQLLAVVEGRDLGAEAAGEVVIGKDLAAQLEVKLGQELVLLGEASDGSLANGLFKVVGIADAGSADMNAGSVFLHLADAQEFFALGSGVHQILVSIPGQGEDVSQPVALLREALDLHTLEVLGWTEISPELEGVVRGKRQGFYIFNVLVFVIVGLAILNTMAMSTFERTREFGVMASLGTRRRRILGLMLLESLLQCGVALVVGLALGIALLYSVGTVDVSAVGDVGVAGFRFPKVLVLAPSVSAIVSASVTALITALAGGLWPAWRASRLRPVEAVRRV
ncbi:MAG: ABC transporter permease [Deltaproteobacteria bacterium]|nr:ABC transporter permease [Deltaproteobacteria bacterium]